MVKPQSRKPQQAEKPDDGMREKMISLNCVTKVVKGGRLVGFAPLPVVVDGNLTAIVSIGDIVKGRIDELQTEHEYLISYLHQ